MTHHDDEIEIPFPIVYLPHEEVFGIMISNGAFFSKIRYRKDEVDYEVLVENEDIWDGV